MKLIQTTTVVVVWRIIEKQSKGKAIILTTHSMEEADASSRIIGHENPCDHMFTIIRIQVFGSLC